MSLIQQVTLLAAGAQPWYVDVCSAFQDRFAYAATQAIYIYQFDAKFCEFKLHSIVSEHRKPITSIQWHPKDRDILASSSVDNQLIIWNVSARSLVAVLRTARSPPTILGWNPCDSDIIAYIDDCGPLYMWRYTSNANQPVNAKDVGVFSNTVTLFRWHPTCSEKIVFGHLNSTLSLHVPGMKSIRHAIIEGIPNENGNSVIGLEWDPLSADYVLVAHRMSGMCLVDWSNGQMNVITRFCSPSTATMIRTIGWIPNAPGMIISGDYQNGILRIWNASKTSPIENLKLKETGFRMLVPVMTERLSLPTPEQRKLSASSRKNSTLHFMPKIRIVCLFMDGGIGLYNLAHRRWDFIRNMGHIETIFDCKLKPDNPEILATSSFDGTIKVWDISSMTPLQSSVGNESIIYCISWAPADLDCIAAATSKNGVIIWHMKKGTVIRKFVQHGSECVFAVAWNQKDARCIASGGGDYSCSVNYADGKNIKTYLHPGVVYGVDWLPNSSCILATACEDGVVRTFNTSTVSNSCEKSFVGHSEKAFQVKWNPLKEGILCSSSDDRPQMFARLIELCAFQFVFEKGASVAIKNSIRIWDYESTSCISILHGHTSNVRGLAWSPEIPFLLFSGSWDSTIRAWDARDGACLDAAFDHGADVYGLSIHPDKPFVLISSSRDTTLRVWSVLSLTPLLPVYVFTRQPWSELIAFADKGYKLGVPSLLCGKRSMELKAMINSDGNNSDVVFREFSKLFSHSWGVTNLWDLIKTIQGCELNQLSPNYHKGIIHAKHVARIKASEAEELQMVTSSRFGQGGIAAPTREDCLRAAAEIHLQIGDLRRYCQILVELGDWDRALAIAPAVSLDFWNDLASRHFQELLQKENEGCLSYGLATGNLATVKQYLLKHRRANDVFVLVAAEKYGTPSETSKPVSDSEKHENYPTPSVDLNSSLETSVSLMAEQYFNNGSPVHAACCCLAADDVNNGLLYLIRGQELELAVAVSMVLKVENKLANIALQYLARRCERLGQWDFAMKLLQLFSGNEDALWMTCARCGTSLCEQESLYKLAKLPNKDECLKKAEASINKREVKNAMKYYLLTTQPEAALVLGVKTVNKQIQSENWNVQESWEILQFLGCLRFDKIHDQKFERQLQELLIYCSYIGALMAIRKQFYPAVIHLFTSTRIRLESQKTIESNFPITIELVRNELEAWIKYRNSDLKAINNNDELLVVYTKLLIKAGQENQITEVGPTISTGSHLPTHSDTHICCLTGEKIQGPAFFLEDGHSAIALNTALMWAKVNPFSPIGNGVRINPF